MIKAWLYGIWFRISVFFLICVHFGIIRYTIQAMVMFGDLFLIGSSALALYFCWKIFPANIIVLFLVLKCFEAWQEEGGFSAWNPSEIKKFMLNAKALGL